MEKGFIFEDFFGIFFIKSKKIFSCVMDVVKRVLDFLEFMFVVEIVFVDEF